MSWTYDEFGNLVNLTTLTDPITKIKQDGWVINGDGTATRLCVPGADCYSYSRLLDNLIEEYRNRGSVNPVDDIKKDGYIIARGYDGNYFALRPCANNAPCHIETRPIRDLLDQYSPQKMVQSDSSPVYIPLERLSDSLVPLNQITNISRAFTQQLGIIGGLNLTISNVTNMVSHEIDKVQTELFKDIEMTAEGFLDFSYDEFIQPVNDSLLQMATVPQAVLVTPPMYYKSLYEDIVNLKQVIDDTLNKQINLKDLLPKFFSRCPIFDRVLNYAVQLPEEFNILLSNIAGGITGPLNTLMETLEYYSESVYYVYSQMISSGLNAISQATQYIASLTDIIGIVPYILNKVKNEVVNQLIDFFNSAVFENPFISTITYATSFLNDEIAIINDMLLKSNEIISCLGGFGSENVSDLLEEQSKIQSELRDLQYNPLTKILKRTDDYVSARVSFVSQAIDASIKHAENQSKLVEENILPVDIVGSVLSIVNYTYSKSKTKDTHYTIEYLRLYDNTTVTVTMTEEMLWQVISDLIIAINGSYIDDTLPMFYRFLDTYDDIDTLIDQCNKESSFYFDRFNRFLYYLICESLNKTHSKYALLDLNILDAINFTTTYIVHRMKEKTSYYEYYQILKDIIFKGCTLGTFDHNDLEKLLVYIKTNDIDDPDLREETRLYALLNLVGKDEIDEVMESFRIMTDYLDPPVDIPESTVDPTLLGEADLADWPPEETLIEREEPDDWYYTF